VVGGMFDSYRAGLWSLAAEGKSEPEERDACIQPWTGVHPTEQTFVTLARRTQVCVVCCQNRPVGHNLVVCHIFP
jgi:hypothetical protein